MLKYKLPIYIDGELLTKIDIKLKYVNVGFEDEKFDYKMFGDFNKLKSFISQKTKIREELLNFDWTINKSIKIDDELYTINYIIKNIYIKDVSFIRDYKINKLMD